MPSLETQLTELNSQKTGVDLNTPFADRIYGLMAEKNPVASQMPQSTQPVSDSVMFDTPVKRIAYDALQKYPFTDEAKKKISELKYIGTRPNKNIDGLSSVEGGYKRSGDNIYNATHPLLGENVSNWLADTFGKFDPANVEMKADTQDPVSAMSHEMMHHLFDSSPMQDTKAGLSWLSTWDKVKKTDKDIGPLLQRIDDHLANSDIYNTQDAYSVATERFAYLAEAVLKYGIKTIPKELRPFYYGIIKGVEKPTPEQLGSNIDPKSAEGFIIDIGTSSPKNNQ